MIRKATAALAVAVLAVAVAAPATAQPSAREGTIVATAAKAGQFKTLAMLLKKAGLVRTLGERGPYTVFAPTDTAFAKVPQRTLDSLLADKRKLRAVLLYHVVAGKVTSARVAELSSAKTLNGGTVRIRVAGSKVFVNAARVTKADVMASNGVIHVLNRVLVPTTS